MKNKLFLLFLLSACFYRADAQEGYQTKVFEYCPAPGQFVHRLPAYEEGDDAERMAGKCLDNLNNQGLVSLGGFGGYITIGFDHAVLNVSGQKDILVLGNAFAGSSEPGIVMVSADTNGDGIPNDKWYELAGSEYNNPSTIHGYKITYTRPAKEGANTPWKDNQGRSGVIQYMGTIGNYPKWIAENMLSFNGTCLPDNGKWNEGQGMWVMKSYEYGYADNFSNDNTEGCSFDIGWAVDEKGEKVTLSGINFVRIYTGVNQQIPTGGVGELSTEVAGVQDLHPAAASIDDASAEKLILNYQDGKLIITNADNDFIYLYNLQGTLLKYWLQEDNYSIIPVSLSKGIYIIQTLKGSCKLIVK